MSRARKVKVRGREFASECAREFEILGSEERGSERARKKPLRGECAWAWRRLEAD